MSPDQELLNLAGAESESKTLFDELAGLVPAEQHATELAEACTSRFR
jgi:hypothetical protein